MTPAQSVENFYQEELEEDDEALSVAGTEYSEAPSVARSYTISHNSNQVQKKKVAKTLDINFTIYSKNKQRSP